MGIEDSESTVFHGESAPPPKDQVYVNVLSIEELKSLELYRAAWAEILATAFFVGFSISAILAGEQKFIDEPSAFHVFIIVYHMLLILIVIFAFAHLSGAHFNPAVSLTLLFTRRITIVRCVFYIAAQMIGSVAGAGFIYLATNKEQRGTLATPALALGVSEKQGFATETFLTFGLLFGTFATAFDPRGWGKLGPIAIAIIVGLNIHAGAHLTGGVMNPARAFGPAVIADEWKDQWIFWAGPILGAVLGGLIYEVCFMFRDHARPKGVPSLAGDNHYIHKKNN